MIKENIDKFISSIRSVDNIVLCVGAGVSITSGLPSYRDLVEEILSVLQPKDKVLKQELNKLDFQNLPLIMDFIIQEYGNKRVDDIIRKIYRDSEIKPSELLNSIARFPAKAYITTNIDSLLENRLNYFNKEYEVYTNDIDLFHKETTPVIKLNGSIDGQSYYVNYFKNYRFNIATTPHLHAQLVSLIQSSVLIFVGFSLHSLEAFYELYSVNAKLDWFFVNVNNRNSLEERIWINRGINIINFELHSEIPEFLNSLTNLIKSKPKEISRKKNRKIFISSSIENSNITNRLRRGLVDAGFDIFIDRDSFSAGLTIYESIDKILSEVSTAIILYPEKALHRHMDNFMFEMGYVTAKLGRNNIIVVVPENADKLPSEFSGNIYFKYGNSDLNTDRIVDFVVKNFDK